MKDLDEYIKTIVNGSTYGLKGYVIEEALSEFLRRKHTQMHTNNPRPRVHYVCDRIILKVKERGEFEQVHKQVLIDVIGLERGSDPRTVNKWLKNLLRYRYLKSSPLNPNLFLIQPTSSSNELDGQAREIIRRENVNLNETLELGERDRSETKGGEKE